MSLYSQFDTNKSLETNGFALELVDDDGSKITFILARAGGANKAFTNELTKLMRPYARMPEGDARNKLAEQMTVKAMAKHIVVAWDNVKDRNGEPLDYSPENCEALLLDLPDLAEFLIREANKLSNFLAEDRTDAAKS